MKLLDVVLGVDFDGTCVIHDFPRVGEDVKYCVAVLKRAVDAGAKLCLNTMRSGKYLEDAVKWFADRDIPLMGINENPNQKSWTSSPKVYAHAYIDDAAIGCPLIENGDKPYVDWLRIALHLFGKDHKIEAIIIENDQMATG